MISMMMSLFAQHGVGVAGWDIGHILIIVIIIAACIGIAVIAFRVFEVKPPPWAIQMFWVVVVAAVAIFAIRFLLTL